jgi:hypothetical protein
MYLINTYGTPGTVPGIRQSPALLGTHTHVETELNDKT